MRSLITFLLLPLSPMAACAVEPPVATPDSHTQSKPPAATCSQPAPVQIMHRPQQAVGQCHVESAEGLLARWEARSATLFKPGEAERVRLIYDHPELSGHEISLLLEFRGPVEAEALGSRYGWSKESHEPSLRAVPIDEIERMFVPAFRVSFDQAGLPNSLTFLTPEKQPLREVALHTALRPRRLPRPAPAQIRTASAEDVDTVPAGVERISFQIPPMPVGAGTSPFYADE
jgi:hypothetical protein